MIQLKKKIMIQLKKKIMIQLKDNKNKILILDLIQFLNKTFGRERIDI